MDCALPDTHHWTCRRRQREPRHRFHWKYIQCPFLCGHGAAETLISHNHTNGSVNSDALFKFYYGAVICNSSRRPVVFLRWREQKIHCFKFTLELNIKMLVTAERIAPASCYCVTLNINTAPVIRKIAREAVSPSLSPFEGHFAAQRQTPNTLPERGAHPLPHRADRAAQRRERRAKNKRGEKKPSSQSRPHTGFCHCRSKSPQSHRSLPL